jgi:hypothetical protein
VGGFLQMERKSESGGTEIEDDIKGGYWHEQRFSLTTLLLRNFGNLVRVTTDYGLDGWCSIPCGARYTFSLLHSVQTDSGAHPPFYRKGSGYCFSGGKAIEARSWPLTFIWCWSQEW